MGIPVGLFGFVSFVDAQHIRAQDLRVALVYIPGSSRVDKSVVHHSARKAARDESPAT
jgi:hypothetical protein